jgi:hypothetical protein
MGGSKEKSLDDEQRLLAMREYLGVRTRPGAPGFAAEIVDAAVGKVQPVIEHHSNSTGEVIVEAIAKQLGVRFEEVRSDSDIQRLEKKYLVEKKKNWASECSPKSLQIEVSMPCYFSACTLRGMIPTDG